MLPTAYLPPLEYMLYLTQTENATIELHETYPKQTWRNRCTIMTANGPLNLVVPVSRPHGNRSMTGEVLLSSHESWHNTHWRAISGAYSKAPYFLYYGDLVGSFFIKKPTGSLCGFNLRMLSAILKELDIQVAISHTRSFEKTVQVPDLRGEMTPKLHLRKRQPVTNWQEYYQVFSDKHGFIPNLSIIDLLFHLGPDTKPYLEEAAQSNLP